MSYHTPLYGRGVELPFYATHVSHVTHVSLQKINRMRAAIVRQFGAPENILVESGFPIPTVDEKQILVQVHSAGVNPVDTYIRSGTYAALPSLPYTPGSEGAGIISKVGTNVKNLKVGDRVWFNQPITGSTAQFALINAELTYPLSERLSFSQAATLGIAYMTAYKALFDKTFYLHGNQYRLSCSPLECVLSPSSRDMGILLPIFLGIRSHTAQSKFASCFLVSEIGGLGPGGLGPGALGPGALGPGALGPGGLGPGGLGPKIFSQFYMFLSPIFYANRFSDPFWTFLLFNFLDFVPENKYWYKTMKKSSSSQPRTKKHTTAQGGQANVCNVQKMSKFVILVEV
ncbi:alcohol dehydrogenase groES-like domain-containing protein [Ditylenchus destructor]|uniref:Alcohol dehydrogenase groES-like domain-containing protein n=1 Tax=Ditylenchus destructor TaxID=166010 RepID=A0AAD4N517_9BILA|nr:alcohol dehydrogenase groES-like domain-containing protein [Ditylenchus destructor]